jgi:hypothetical protein
MADAWFRKLAKSRVASAVLLVGLAAAACVTDLGADFPGNPNGRDPGEPCVGDEECKSLTCENGQCTSYGSAPIGGEAGTQGVGCGSESGPKCENGKTCTTNANCTSNACVGGVCKEPLPNDGMKNGDETDVDCGGVKAPKCALDKGCEKNADCVSDACAYTKRCIAFKTCTRHFGGDTCGAGETGTQGAQHESCCTTVPMSATKRVSKYHVTAGRMRAFVERFDGNLQQWAATNPNGWNPAWNPKLPANMSDALYLLGPGGKRGCTVTPQGKGARTYWQPDIDGDHSDFSQDVLDEKVLNCVSWQLAQALCVFEGGRLTSHAENLAIMTNGGKTAYPWQFQDKSPYNPSKSDARVVNVYSYATPNPPAGLRVEGGTPVDRAFYIAPPGRRPAGANEIGVQDAVGNVLTWANDGPQTFSWTMSWEMHQKQNQSQAWAPGDKEAENGYYALGARCVFE